VCALQCELGHFQGSTKEISRKKSELAYHDSELSAVNNQIKGQII
jgi:hypothetical protein